MQKQKNKIMIELGNAAQKGPYKWETHGRYRLDEKKMQKY